LIELALFFALGFLFAAFLALVLMPPVFRRVAALTRKRVEAELPMSMNELQAEKDQLRAGFAIQIRRLEQEIEHLRGASARHMVAAGRNEEEVKALSAVNAEEEQELAALRGELDDLRARLKEREGELTAVSAQLAETEDDLDSRRRAYEALDRDYLDASTTADNRQIELAAKQTEVDRFADEIAQLRREKRSAEAKLHETAMKTAELEEIARNEQNRHSVLEKRLDELLRTIADREETLERRAKEIARLSEQQLERAREVDRLKSELEESRASLSALRSKLWAGEADGIDLGSGPADGRDPLADRARLEMELEQVMLDKQAVLGRLAAVERAAAGKRDQQSPESEALRDQIRDLAAQVVHLTAQIEGPDSPILKVLEEAERQPIRIENGRAVISLADRVQALRRGAASQG